MKKLSFFALIILQFVFLSKPQAQTTISMGPGYAQDVYYSFDNGVVANVDRSNWDIGFYTYTWSAGIITNDGAGIELYVYPAGDTNQWMAIDTSGFASWKMLVNGEDSWENGAFNRGSGAGHPDYGWGMYSNISHDVIGDSIHIIKLADGTLKKLWIVKKLSIQNTFVIRYADLDNSNEVELIHNNNDFMDVNFSYFSFSTGDFLTREPAKSDWDILFTKYQAMQPQGVTYPVVGVLNNVGVKANRFHPFPHDYTDWYSQPMDSLRSVIGYDWKAFSMQAMEWTLQDSLLFFVNTLSDNIYKIYFTGFVGSSSGEISFATELITGMGLADHLHDDFSINLAPNPASDKLSVSWTLQDDATISIYDLSGKKLYEQTYEAQNNNASIDISSFHTGMYLVSIIANGKQVVEKLMVE